MESESYVYKGYGKKYRQLNCYLKATFYLKMETEFFVTAKIIEISENELSIKQRAIKPAFSYRINEDLIYCYIFEMSIAVVSSLKLTNLFSYNFRTDIHFDTEFSNTKLEQILKNRRKETNFPLNYGKLKQSHVQDYLQKTIDLKRPKKIYFNGDFSMKMLILTAIENLNDDWFASTTEVKNVADDLQ